MLEPLQYGAVSAEKMNSNITKLALAFSLILMIISGFVIAYLSANYRGAISMEGKIIEFKAGSVPVIAFNAPDGKQMHFSDPLGSVPDGKKTGDSVTILYVPKNGHVRLFGTSTVEVLIYLFFGIGVITFIGALAYALMFRQEPKQGISGLYGR